MCLLTLQEVTHLPVATLFQYCQEETTRFLHQQPHDPRFGLELFRRASLGDNVAWECLYLQYAPMVSRWIERNPAMVYSGEEVQYLVNRTFERMWRRLSPQTFAGFEELRQILRYLELCANSCLLDFNRKYKGKTETSLTLLDQGHPAMHVEGEMEKLAEGQRTELWQTLLHLVTDEMERVVLVASFLLNLKPQQIQARYAQYFHTVVDVYRVKQNLLQRLRRSPQLQEFAN
ncbi:MAG: sigma-70 family RNA polymerase sigma factor [Chloroflexi bacterium]|nr:sigma-70 family RNA polymerase sigma factor [Chloroflexota bacterium]MBP8060119.1 sigma-70 family RNA polymerase sigma factor [Chloroflexota bacterium]